MKKRLFVIPSLIAAGLFPNKSAATIPTGLVSKEDPKPTLLQRFRLQHEYTLAGHRSHSSHASHSSHRSSSGGGYSTRSAPRPAPVYRAPSRRAQPAPTAPSGSFGSSGSSSSSGSSFGILGTPSPAFDDPSDWEVVGVVRKTAWLRKKNSASADLIEVEVGEEVTGLGRVLDVQENGSSWNVRTEAGDITDSGRPTASRNTNSVPNSSILPSSPSVAPKVLPGNSEKFKKIVVQVQTALFAYGYYTSTIDGLVGPQTRVALSKMQSDYGLKVTGTVTPEVLNALGIVAE